MTTLPGVLAEIEEVAGRQAALTIAASHGGLTKGFPSPPLLRQSPDSYADNCVARRLRSPVGVNYDGRSVAPFDRS